MKRSASFQSNQFSPRQQRNWDWRAAANFIGGGAGGSLVFWAALMAGSGVSFAAVFVGLGLVAAGLTCVWFEIGQPWRALNVFRHPSTSWMTREAAVAPLLFASGGLALLTQHPAALYVAGFFGLCFVYSQARILSADKGIPAWRHPRCLPLVVASGVCEGLALLLGLLLLAGGAAGLFLPLLLLVMLLLRLLLWKRYLSGLRQGGAPDAAVLVLAQGERLFVGGGHGLPALLLLLGCFGFAGQGLLFAAGAALALAGGWFFKYTLVRRAAYTQGIAMPHLPARGRGTAGAAIKPGWRSVN